MQRVYRYSHSISRVWASDFIAEVQGAELLGAPAIANARCVRDEVGGLSTAAVAQVVSAERLHGLGPTLAAGTSNLPAAGKYPHRRRFLASTSRVGYPRRLCSILA